MEWAESPQPKELRKRFSPHSHLRKSPSSPYPVNAMQQSCALRRLSETTPNRYVYGSPRRQTIHALPSLDFGASKMTKNQPLKYLVRSLTGTSTPEKAASSKIGNGSGGTPVKHKFRNYSPELTKLREDGNKKKSSFFSYLFQLIYGFLYRVFSVVFYIIVFAMAVLSVGTLMHQYRHIKTGVCMYYKRYVNVSLIQGHLSQELYGQHIAAEVLVQQLSDHCDVEERYSRPLVLSLHGWTGGGKSLASSLVAREFPAENVHEIIVPLHFPHAADGDLYAARLNASIMSHAQSCDKHLFIIDDVDKATWDFPSALRSTLLQLRATKLQHATVVIMLLSNTGASDINKFSLGWLSAGQSRDSLKHKDLHDILLRHRSWHTELYQEGLLTALVPFLPLEQSHVEQCVQHDLQVKGHKVRPDVIEKVVNDILFFPPSSPVFAASGCRKVTTLVDLKLS